MSADNIIYIQKRDNMYHIWHDFASNDNPIPSGPDHAEYISESDALLYAHDLVDKIGYVEYGVCRLKLDNTDKVLNQIQEIRAQNNKSWMAILRLAFKHAPDEAKVIMKNITACDQEISKLCKELTK